MLSLTNPWVLIGIAIALAGAFFQGSEHEKLRQQAEIARLNQAAQEQKEKADEALYKEKQNAQAKITQLNTALASGALRLSIPVKTSVCDPTAPAGDGQARAELDGQTAQDLVAITADGDKAIIDLNSCIDRYNALRELK
jgi:type II secretory pathway pseudopilin PulG